MMRVTIEAEDTQRHSRTVRLRTLLFCVLVVAAVFLAGCGGGSSASKPPPSTTASRVGASPSDCSNMCRDATVRVPDVIGMILPDAIRAVETAGLNVVGYGTAPGDPTGDSAIVTAQKPDGIVPAGACIGFRTK
jgi:PASTA domain